MTGMEKVWGGAVDCYKEGGKELCDSEKGLRLHSSVHLQTLHNIKTDLCNSGVSKKKKKLQGPSKNLVRTKGWTQQNQTISK